MIWKDEKGSVSSVISIVILSIALIGSLVFCIWAYQGRQDYKNNVDQKINAAVVIAKQQESSAKDLIFAEQQKQPLQPYKGPSSFGSISILYPKTWSGYVDTTNNDGNPIDGYFYPGVVPGISDQSVDFALRIQVIDQSYDQTAAQFSSQVAGQTLSVSAYALPKLPNVIGMEVSGQIAAQKTGTMVVLPLRDKTLEIWTEGNQYLSDFSNNILPNFSFSP